MWSVESDAVPAGLDASQSHMQPAGILETPDLAQ